MMLARFGKRLLALWLSLQKKVVRGCLRTDMQTDIDSNLEDGHGLKLGRLSLEGSGLMRSDIRQ